MNFVCDELCIAQDELVAGILGEAGLGDVAFTGVIPANLLLTQLAEKKLLRRFISVVATPEGKEFDEATYEELQPEIAKLKSSAMVKVIDDFLSSNEAWVSLLKKRLVKMNSTDATDGLASATQEELEAAQQEIKSLISMKKSYMKSAAATSKR